MKTLNLEDLSPESAEAVVEVLGIITGKDQNVQIKIDGKTVYSVIKEEQVSEDALNDIADEEEALARKYAPRPGESVSSVIQRILEDGPILDEKFDNMTFKKFRQEAWGRRGVH